MTSGTPAQVGAGMADAVRHSVEWLAHNAQVYDMAGWDTHSNVLLAAAHRVEQLEAAIRSHVEDLARVAQIFRDYGMKASADETDTAVAELRAALSGVSP